MKQTDKQKILIGLGNPGKKYENTRHNVGFMFLDTIAKSLTSESTTKTIKNTYTEISIAASSASNNWSLILLYPLQFMNHSGEVVKKYLNYHNYTQEDIVIIHDDLDIELGNYKWQLGTGPKIHNGVNSIENALQNKGFWRLRLGVDNRAELPFQGSGADYVLAQFAKSEEQKVSDMLITARQYLWDKLAQ